MSTHSPGRRVLLVPGEQPEPFEDNYRLMALVGQGQFAQVYCAIHRQTGELVAIKKTRHQPEQISQEPFVLNELCHPNIVCAQAIAKTPTGYQFVLDYCEAGTLRSHLKNTVRASASTPSLLKKIIEDILNGLSYIHRYQVIHGDLKPENILLTYQDRQGKKETPRPTARIGDFGSARLINMPNPSRREIGSPTYAAPERFEGKSSQASDLYSVGVILYELLLGDRPFSGNADQLRQAHQTQTVSFGKNVPPSLQTFFQKALHKQSHLRFGSADEMLNMFQSLSDTAPDILSAVPSHKLPLKQLNTPALHYLSAQISEPIKQLLNAPQGCFAITDRAIYLLDSQMALTELIQFDQPVWVSISPKGNWLAVFPQSEQQTVPHTGQLVFLRNAKITSSRTVTLQRQLSQIIQANVAQVVAIDRRYLLRVLTSAHQNISCLEIFTRKGQPIVNLPLNLPLSCATLTSEPYQIFALSMPTDSEQAQGVLITLCPFQIKSVNLSQSNLNGLGIFSWGFAVFDQSSCLFLDRSMYPIGRLSLRGISAIAPLKNNKILIARTSKLSAATQKNTPPEIQPSSGAELLTVDLNELNLDLIL